MMPVIMLLVCVVLMAFFNAVMDATENENFSESIFKNLAQRFWYKRVSWHYAKRIFGYKIDAWHIAKSCFVICFVLALVAAVVVGKNIYVQLSMWDYLLFISGLGVLWNGCFILFYHIIFKVK